MASGGPGGPIIPKPGSILSFPGFTRTALPSGISSPPFRAPSPAPQRAAAAAAPKPVAPTPKNPDPRTTWKDPSSYNPPWQDPDDDALLRALDAQPDATRDCFPKET